MSTPLDDEFDNDMLQEGLGRTLGGAPAVRKVPPGLAQALSPASGDDAASYATVYYYSGDGHNPAGHMGMSIDGGPAFGFVPAFDATGWIPASQPGLVDMVDPKRKVLGELRIPMSATQAQDISKYMVANAGPNTYNVAGFGTPLSPAHNCATFVSDGLAAAGLQVPKGPDTVVPALLLRELKKIYGKTSPQ